MAFWYNMWTCYAGSNQTALTSRLLVDLFLSLLEGLALCTEESERLSRNLGAEGGSGGKVDRGAR